MGCRAPRLLCALLVQVGCATSAPSQHAKPVVAKPVEPVAEAAPKRVPPHPVIEAYISGLAGVLTDAELVSLATVSFDDTNAGDVQRLRYLAADRAVRRFLPAALEASGDPTLIDYAQRIRALPPLLNPDTDTVAYEIVAEALRARARVEHGMPALPPKEELVHAQDASTGATPKPGAAVPNAATPSAPAPGPQPETALAAVHDDPEARAEYANALAEYAETYAKVYGVSPLYADSAAAAAADAADAALLLSDAIAHGADRAEMVKFGIDLARELADSARRRERIPLPKLQKEPAPGKEP